MKKISLFVLCVVMFGLTQAQRTNYSIEYENHKVGVFNPEWEISHTLNPNKYEHITGYFREELARTIIDAVKQKRVKIYDNRKRELTVDTVISKIIAFEKQQGTFLDRKNALDYIIPFMSAYDFEEAVTYHFDDLSIEKKVIAYQPYIVHYKTFSDDKNDSVQLPLFWIFPKDTLKDDPKHPVDKSVMAIPDTVLSVLQLKYPVKMPFTSNLFDYVQNKKINILKSDGSEFKTPKEIDDLFVLHRTAMIYIEQTDKDSVIDTYSDIIPDDITAIRIAENWGIKKHNLEIVKTVRYFLPLYPYDDDTFTQLGCRINVNRRK